MQNSDIRRKVKQLLPEIGRAARVRHILSNNWKYFAGTHLAALGRRRCADLIAPYIADPRRNITSYSLDRLSSDLDPVIGEDHIVVSRTGLTPEFATALGAAGGSTVYVKFIRGKLVVLPKLDGRYYFYSRDATHESSIKVHTGQMHSTRYLPCGLELCYTRLWNRHAGLAFPIRFTSPNICDDFGEEQAMQAVHYLGECTSAFLQVTVV